MNERAIEADEGAPSYRNEHHAYRDIDKDDRRALKQIISTAFPVGDFSHGLWKDFYETMVFTRHENSIEAPSAETIVGAAIVTTHADLQLDYLRYLVVRPEYRYRKRWLLPSGEQPHHGTILLHYIYDVMRRRITQSRMQRELVIEAASPESFRFYEKALPANEFPVKFDPENLLISVPYDGLAL